MRLTLPRPSLCSGALTRTPLSPPSQASEWAAEVAEAHAGLVAALEELAAREDDLGRYERLVRGYHDRVADMLAQQSGERRRGWRGRPG